MNNQLIVDNVEFVRTNENISIKQGNICIDAIASELFIADEQNGTVVIENHESTFKLTFDIGVGDQLVEFLEPKKVKKEVAEWSKY